MSTHKKVKLNRPGMKSVFAFFLLPQFWRSMGHFQHIGPVFTRTLALMLAQSGLLPLNHPATRNGYTADGKRIKASTLMSEAWFFLRTRDNMGVYQWGMFISLIFMFASLIGSVVLGVVYFMSGSIAQAQLFNHPGPGASNVIAPGGGGTLFNRDVPGAGGTTQDLALSILDRVLRQPANGLGGSMQQAIAPMLGTYSTAVLVIASFLIFWSIVSIVVDTARTGQLGGGRHNMVWTPIRFVFALGILVPIGGAFNSGQMIVLKLAEWGSNLGTNMWGTYAATAANQSLLASGVSSSNPTGNIVKPLFQALICTKQNNASQEIAVGSIAAAPPGRFSNGTYDPMATGPAHFSLAQPGMDTAFGAANPPGVNQIESHYIREILDQQSRANHMPTVTFAYGNEVLMNLCGTVSLPNPEGRDITYLPGPAPALVVHSPQNCVAPTCTGAAGDPLDEVSLYKRLVRQAEWDALNAAMPRLMALACHTISIGQKARTDRYPETCSASAFLQINAPPGPANGTTMRYNDGCNPFTGGPGGTTDHPPRACLDRIIQDYVNSRNAAINGARAGLAAFFADNGPFETSTIRQGWAGMGAWYYRIAGVNRAHTSSRTPETAVQGGADPAKVAGHVYTKDDQEAAGDCSGVIGWIGCAASSAWDGVSSVAKGAWDLTTGAVSLVTDGWESAVGSFPLSGLPSSVEDGKIIMRWALKQMEIGDGGLLVNIGGYGSLEHPMASLSKAGADIMDKAFALYGAIAFMSLFAGIPFVGGAVEALMDGPVGNFLGMIASFGLIPGLMLLYYVPLVPWIKVMFAVVAWIVSVIEAVITIPIVALAHLRTDGEGIMGPMAQGAYIAWLNLLLRPGLVVIGFVFGNAIFESMILFMNDTYQSAVSNMGTGGYGIIDQVVNTYIYVFAAFSLVNASFKMVDIIPNTTMAWLGGPATDTFAGEAAQTEQMINQMSDELARGIGQTAGTALSSVATGGAGLARGGAEKTLKGAGGLAKKGAGAAINKIRGS